MNTNPHAAPVRARARRSPLAPLLACLATLMGLPAHAAVSLPDTPMQTNNGVPPNIWFILDDSGSMAWRYMYNPVITELVRGGGTRVATSTGDNRSTDSTYGANSANSTTLAGMYDQTYVTNTIYYDPRITYRPWQRADGSFMNATPYNAAFSSNTLASGGTTNLNGQVQTFYVPGVGDPSDARIYTRYTFLTDGTAQACTWNILLNTFSVCLPAVAFTWSGPIVRTLPQEKENFANWFSFHRTRSKLAKANSSFVFNDPTIFNDENDYRVGFTTIWQRGEFRIPVGTNNGLFTGANRNTWFTQLFGAGASDGTPLIPALTRAGQYYEETGNGGPWGPQATAAQFECRQNFSILTTDGYWNNGATAVGTTDAANGASISRPDGPPYQYVAARPFQDAWSNTLADVAMHYWKRDLRTDLINTVPASASNPAFWQHMVTFGISIGLRGRLDPNVDMPALTSGAKVWPNPTDAEDLERIDDLFHASVNGRGAFVAASNPNEFAEGLGNALRAIAARRGSGSNATVTGSSTSGGTKVFQAKFFSASWHGEVQAYPVSASGVDSANPAWTATVPLVGARNLYTHNGSGGAAFPTTLQTTALTPIIANYIRGDRSQEQQYNALGLLRNRTTLLGDIVNSSPTYVKTGANETVYVGANDGMLHAFNAADGVERFAYVPTGIDLAKLREFSVPTYGHRFFVDGPIVTSTPRDISNRTVLVGTLGRGGRGLFALDVTDPTGFNTTKVLWDKNASFDSDMGQVMGKPLIARLNDGSVALLVPNGLNSSGDHAVLFVLDLLTGNKIAEIDTGVGNPGQTNGLFAPRGWDSDGNGTVDAVYAGDLRGNLWKFDLSSASAGSWNVANGRPLYAPTPSVPQPITGGVTIGIDPNTDKRWIFFGTGRLLTNSDITDVTRQSWYGVIDDESATSSVNRAGMTARDIPGYDAVSQTRAFQANAGLPAASKGWYIDLDMPPSNTLEGERMLGDQQIIKNALIAASVIPSTSNPCLPGRGYVNAVDAFSGTSLTTGLFDANRNGTFGDDNIGGNAVGSIDLGVGMVTDPALLDKLLVAGGSLATLASTPLDPALYGGRISWREIFRR